MFGKVLIANRGEISVRIVRALREMGVASVAVYSDADRDSLHARIADEAYHIGPTPATESYLNVERLLEAAHKSGAEAVHPGYGFLAESAAFARAVTGAGLVWIGPHPAAIEAMGSKVESRRIMAKAGVPMVPGTESSIGSAKEVRIFGEEHGFPVAVKASAGGGGKGFAVARAATEAEGAYSRASREGEAYFGDGSVYVEKYLSAPRHVEIQVVRDKHGNAVHLGERDCSIQRRHQKLLEECPSPAIDPRVREAMGEAALAAADAVGYDNVGTVEFLVEGDGDEFYFLEMNTRVQVEHPVTEEVTGIDIVKTGVRVAAGEPLPFSQEDISWRGHAIEVRLNAEDATRDFAPSPGVVTLYEEPGGPGVRVDSSLRGPGVVAESYDPLFAKLIVRGGDREETLARLGRALAEFRVEGISTTLPFFRAILADEAFFSGDYTTGFVADRMERLEIQTTPPSEMAEIPLKNVREVEVEVNGRLFRVKVFGDEGAPAGGPPRRRRGETRRASASGGAIAAPMQGTIVKVLVEEGQEVEADEPVCILEAMKMESEVRSQKAGTVSEVRVESGQTVRSGEPLIVVE
ncbi:MAG: acetyl-CoA carboxylase biotin carboxylase subunit [Rubrobacter sp.]|nr:acetyl-CoA carboxylase biotin carboxylase subunit [Rubrobacter sp.]